MEDQREKKFSLEERRISVTSLLQPAHMTRLLEAHGHEVALDPDDAIPALVGTAWHRYVEQFQDQRGSSELELRVQIGGWTVTGKPDWFDQTRLIDHKTTRVWSAVFGRPEWEQQLNIYRWLVNQVYGYDIRQLEVHVVYLDWSESASLRNPDLPHRRFEVTSVPVWELNHAQHFIESAIDDLVSGSSICDPEERWERGERWAVMKPGRKTAMKLCNTEAEAEGWARNGTNLYIEHRPGDPVRCRRYCPVSPFCDYGRVL